MIVLSPTNLRTFQRVSKGGEFGASSFPQGPGQLHTAMSGSHSTSQTLGQHALRTAVTPKRYVEHRIEILVDHRGTIKSRTPRLSPGVACDVEVTVLVAFSDEVPAKTGRELIVARSPRGLNQLFLDQAVFKSWGQMKGLGRCSRHGFPFQKQGSSTRSEQRGVKKIRSSQLISVSFLRTNICKRGRDICC